MSADHPRKPAAKAASTSAVPDTPRLAAASRTESQEARSSARRSMAKRAGNVSGSVASGRSGAGGKAADHGGHGHGETKKTDHSTH